MTNKLRVFENYNNERTGRKRERSDIQKAIFKYFLSLLLRLHLYKKKNNHSALENLQRRTELYIIHSYNFRGGFITRLKLVHYFVFETDIDILKPLGQLSVSVLQSQSGNKTKCLSYNSANTSRRSRQVS